MRSIILFIGFSLFCLSLYPQRIYFGYPMPIDEIKKEDRILLNIPTHRDGRFIPEKGLNSLIEFLNTDSSSFFRIEIHFFYGNEEFAEDYSEFTCKNLKWYLESACKFTNYELYHYGKSHPIFLDKDSLIYREINTRMEILVQ